MDQTGTRHAVARGLDDAATVVGVILMAVSAAFAPIWAGLNGMSSDACSAACRYDLIGLGSGISAFGPAVVLVATVGVLLMRAHWNRWMSWICALGLLAVFGAVELGDAVITSGLGH